MFCLLVVLVKLSVLAKWLARKTPLKKPNRGEWIVSRKPRQKSAYDVLGLLYCFIVLLCICVVSCPYVIYCPTFMARYSLTLKVPLNPKKTNKIPATGPLQQRSKRSESGLRMLRDADDRTERRRRRESSVSARVDRCRAIHIGITDKWKHRGVDGSGERGRSAWQATGCDAGRPPAVAALVDCL